MHHGSYSILGASFTVCKKVGRGARVEGHVSQVSSAGVSAEVMGASRPARTKNIIANTDNCTASTNGLRPVSTHSHGELIEIHGHR